MMPLAEQAQMSIKHQVMMQEHHMVVPVKQKMMR
jgi:hypothetical protein